MNIKQTILEYFRNGDFPLCTDEQLARLLKLGRREIPEFAGMLRELYAEGELYRDSRGRYGTAEMFRAKRGTISGNPRGFAFFIPDDGSKDLFLPKRALRGVYHGDVVLAFAAGGRSGDEGEVLSVLQRGYTTLTGTYYRDHKAGFLRPDERKFSEDVFLPGKSNGAKNGDKVLVRLFYTDRSLTGEVVEVLGVSGDFLTEELALIRSHELREEFPEDVEREAEDAEARGIDDRALSGRKDLRSELIITVDGEDTRDIDDAISVRKKGKNFELGVHIADVTHYVGRNSALDKEAFERGTSVYFPDRVLPMLPRALSNGICSLNEGVDRLTLSCFMTVDPAGKVLSRSVSPSVIRSRHRMTYTEVTAIVKGDPEAVKKYPDLVPFLKDAAELTRILKRARENRGGVALDVKEAKILFADGKVIIPDYDRSLSHEMIEQFMVLANESVAALMTEQGFPFVYRVHERPSKEKAEEFRTFLKEIGIAASFDPNAVTPEDYKKLLDKLEGSPLSPIVSRIMLRSMMKAVYSPENIGHFGLASECYCHFTSPIRRYPDLCVHRIIKDGMKDPQKTKSSYRNFVKNASVKSSACERNAQEAEREVDALYIVRYMQDHIGEEFEATVSGVTSFGVYAELKNTVEGFIPLETLPDDSYTFYEERYLLRGTRQSFRLGEQIRVKAVGVDWGTRRVQFGFMEKL